MNTERWMIEAKNFAQIHTVFFHEGPPEFTPAEFMTEEHREQLHDVHRMMIGARSLDRKPDMGRDYPWSTCWNDDCKDKAIAALAWMRRRGWPRQSVIPYIVEERRALRSSRFHAVLCAFVTYPAGNPRTATVALDARRATPHVLQVTGPNPLGYLGWQKISTAQISARLDAQRFQRAVGAAR